MTLPGDGAVARVDFGDLADPDVLGLRFRDPQLGLEDRRIGDARDVARRPRPRADFDRQRAAARRSCPALTFRSSSCRSTSSYAARRWLTSASCGASCDLMPALRDLEPLLRDVQLVLQVSAASPAYCFSVSSEISLSL